MKKQLPIPVSLAVALFFALGSLLLPCAAQAQVVSKTAMAGAYSVTLKVLPVESFRGPHPAMTRDAGAQPNFINGPEHPNHHMVVFVRRNNKPVEKASVAISYRMLSPHRSGWTKLPVVRMHVTGKSLATTHYGNNLRLMAGSYEARVAVNGSRPAIFHFSLSH
jgi:hypothetical protein